MFLVKTLTFMSAASGFFAVLLLLSMPGNTQLIAKLLQGALGSIAAAGLVLIGVLVYRGVRYVLKKTEDVA